MSGIPEITAIELGMLARLRATESALGVEWKTLTTYPEDWDIWLAANANVQMPGAWVVFSGWNATDLAANGKLILRDASFALVVGYENKRPDAQVQRHGGPDPLLEPGSYRLILAAIAALTDQNVGVDLISPLQPGAGRHVGRTKADVERGLTRFSVLFTCDVEISLVPEEAGDFQTLHANWDIPSFGTPNPVDRDPMTPGVQLPDDANADATDHLSLEQN